MTYLLGLLFSFSLMAQTTLLSENFSNYYNTGLDAKKSHEWRLDSLEVADSSVTIFTDRVGSKTLSEGVANWPVWSIDNPLYLNGNSLNFAGGTQALDDNGAAITDDFYGCKIVFNPAAAVNNATSAQHVLHLEGSFFGLAFGAASGTVTNEVVLLTDASSNRSYWATTDASAITDAWHVLIMQWDGAKYQVWLDGAEQTTSTTGTPAVLAMDTDFRIGIRADNTLPYLGNISQVTLYDAQLTDQDVNEETFAPKNWKSLNGGFTRDSFGFHLGAVNDTVYYVGGLTSGTWTVSLKDSAGSAVSYKVLTSTNKITWTTLATGATNTSWTTKSYSGSGNNYIAIAVASGTAFFDDLVVTKTATSSRRATGGWLRW